MLGCFNSLIFLHLFLIGVNPGGWGRDPQVLGWGLGGCGGFRGSWNCYSLSCTGSMVKSIDF